MTVTAFGRVSGRKRRDKNTCEFSSTIPQEKSIVQAINWLSDRVDIYKEINEIQAEQFQLLVDYAYTCPNIHQLASRVLELQSELEPEMPFYQLLDVVLDWLADKGEQ